MSNIMEESISEILKEIQTTLILYNERLDALELDKLHSVDQATYCYYCGSSFPAIGWPTPAFCDSCAKTDIDPSPGDRARLLAPLDEWPRCCSCGEILSSGEWREIEGQLADKKGDIICDICYSEIGICENCGSSLSSNDKYFRYVEGGKVCLNCTKELLRCMHCKAFFHTEEHSFHEIESDGKFEIGVCEYCMPGHIEDQYIEEEKLKEFSEEYFEQYHKDGVLDRCEESDYD